MDSAADAPEHVLKLLTLEEKVALLSGRDMWRTAEIPRLGIQSMILSDGPNGARGTKFYGNSTAACFPAGPALAATWDRALVYAVGAALGEEATTKKIDLLLGPTICLPRTPLGGRNFETFSEDPILMGELASELIRGLQEKGIGATVKHYVCNDQETLRYVIDVSVSERALRELYLKPFEIVVRKSKPWAIMTAYNSVNGKHADCNSHLVKTVLREQWGYNGIVMTDWGASTSAMESLLAETDLEMPGPGRCRSLAHIQEALNAKSIRIEHVNRAALSILKTLSKAKNAHRNEYKESDPKRYQLIRQVGSDSLVLLKNSGRLLPLQKSKFKSVALLGLAKEYFLHGGGSAEVTPPYKISPLEALKDELQHDCDIKYARGAYTLRKLPEWGQGILDTNRGPGFTLELYTTPDFQTKPSSSRHMSASRYMSIDERPAAVRLLGIYQPVKSGLHYIGFSAMGSSRVFINDEPVLDVGEDANSDGFMFQGRETLTRYDFVKGTEYAIRVESMGAPHRDIMPFITGMIGFHLGFMTDQRYERDLLAEAIETARSTDLAIICTGNTAEWETEGYDRDTLHLPVNSSQDRLVEEVAKVNPNVIVINFSGNPVAMPWANLASAIVQAWFPGQETGRVVTDVLFGKVNPSAKLPVSFPKTLEDTPTFKHFPGNLKECKVKYTEDLNIGYRYYDRHPEKVLFPFGFGLSYSDFKLEEVTVDTLELSPGGKISISMSVRNTSPTPGAEVVQIYVAPPEESSQRPLKTLAGFTKIHIEPGQVERAEVVIDKESFAFWDSELSLWAVHAGQYSLKVGFSSSDIAWSSTVSVKGAFIFQP